jgi:disulfide bond formation protein DsbB
MMLDNRNLPALILLGMAIAVLGGAYAFQYIGGLQPCALCLYQRWPWWIAGGIGLLALLPFGDARLRGMLLMLGTLAVWAGAGVAVYHVGVEQKWWAGPVTCTSSLTAGSLEDLKALIMAAPVVRCDDIAWSLFGISMAGYNALISLATGAGVVALLRRDLKRR